MSAQVLCRELKRTAITEVTKASNPYNYLEHKTLNASSLSSLMYLYPRLDVRDPVESFAASYQQRRHRRPEGAFEVNLLHPDGCTICMLSTPVTAHLSRASGVRGRGFVGARSNESRRKVVGKTLLRLRKTPCALAQNTLCLSAKSPRLNAKTNANFSSLSQGNRTKKVYVSTNTHRQNYWFTHKCSEVSQNAN